MHRPAEPAGNDHLVTHLIQQGLDTLLKVGVIRGFCAAHFIVSPKFWLAGDPGIPAHWPNRGWRIAIQV
jgi:hypothetical protein